MKHKKFVIIALIVAGMLAVHRLYAYAEDPTPDKDCFKLTMPSDSDLKLEDADLPNVTWVQKGGQIDDVSCLNKTPVYGVVQIRTEDDIKQSLLYAKKKGLKIMPFGVRHSMGGQAIAQNGLALDMRNFKSFKLNEDTKTITVQSGITWHDIQNKINPKYAVKAMQSSDIFSVGGSMSVNAHGMDHRVGSVADTIRWFRIMLPDGTIRRVDQKSDPELFNLVIGGYGMFGIILDTEIDIVENKVYQYRHSVIDYQDFPKIYNADIKNNPKIGLMYGHLSTDPAHLFSEMVLHEYFETDKPLTKFADLPETGQTKLRRFVINLPKLGYWGGRVKWFAEKYLESWMSGCFNSRTQVQGSGEACFVQRNVPMHDSVKYLYTNLKHETDILQEYFIPQDKFIDFVPALKKILQDHKAIVINASVRVVHQEKNILNYAPEDMFAIVLYLNQKTTPQGVESMQRLTSDIIDTTLKFNGTFFLPYQLYYSPQQLVKSYPKKDYFFKAKLTYDPDELLTNKFYTRYK